MVTHREMLVRRARLCARHAAEWDRALDHRSRPPPPQLAAIGAQDTRHVLDALRARYQTWRYTIRHQHHLIETECQEKCRDRETR